MGLDLMYSSGQAGRSIRFTDAEWVYIDRLRAVAPTPINTLFSVADFARAVQVSAEELIAAVDALVQLLRDRPDLQPTTYQWRAEFLPGSSAPDGKWSSGAMSGLRLPGDPDYFYMLRVGPDRCELEKMKVGADGRGVFSGREDLRGRAYVQTETLGRVDLRERSSGAGLRKKLVELREFFAEQNGRPVSKELC